LPILEIQQVAQKAEKAVEKALTSCGLWVLW